MAQPQGGSAYDISASSSATSAAKQTIAKRITRDQGRITFGARKDNKLLYLGIGVAIAWLVLRVIK